MYLLHLILSVLLQLFTCFLGVDAESYVEVLVEQLRFR
jgi:hypothetical protein